MNALQRLHAKFTRWKCAMPLDVIVACDSIDGFYQSRCVEQGCCTTSPMRSCIEIMRMKMHMNSVSFIRHTRSLLFWTIVSLSCISTIFAYSWDLENANIYSNGNRCSISCCLLFFPTYSITANKPKLYINLLFGSSAYT